MSLFDFLKVNVVDKIVQQFSTQLVAETDEITRKRYLSAISGDVTCYRQNEGTAFLLRFWAFACFLVDLSTTERENFHYSSIQLLFDC